VQKPPGSSEKHNIARTVITAEFHTCSVSASAWRWRWCPWRSGGLLFQYRLLSILACACHDDVCVCGSGCGHGRNPASEDAHGRAQSYGVFEIEPVCQAVVRQVSGDRFECDVCDLLSLKLEFQDTDLAEPSPIPPSLSLLSLSDPPPGPPLLACLFFLTITKPSASLSNPSLPSSGPALPFPFLSAFDRPTSESEDPSEMRRRTGCRGSLGGPLASLLFPSESDEEDEDEDEDDDSSNARGL
jgi:hypothetical protein